MIFDELLLRAAIQERDDARSALFELQKKCDQLVVENVRLLKKVNVRVAATCSCGRYPAGACSRCAFDDRYEARQINLDHRTASDLGRQTFEEVGSSLRDLRLVVGAIEPIESDGRKIVLSTTLEGVREMIGEVIDKLDRLFEKR